ncbi:MAG TPA: protein kinase [Candidatus Angelobacter sp.]|jgi:serine/threonine-protein kinase|nr:protein kinase [Candidatus Angelobacter sp.]
MESLHPNQQSVQESERTGVNAALCVDLWAYGGATGKVREVQWRSEGPLANLFAQAVAENEGKFIEAAHNKLLIFFENSLRALAAARSLQLSLLTFEIGPFLGHIVPKMTVNRWLTPRQSRPAAEDVPTQVVESTQHFREPGAPEVPRILVAEEIYKLAKAAGGFDFSASPRIRAGEQDAVEPMYELLWADAASYTRLRQEIQNAGRTVVTQSRYLIDTELGRGAMGVVYKAHDKVIDRTVALKTILVDHNAPNRDELVERLLREAKAAGSLDHPNIITIFDIGQEGDLIYLSMQYVEGETLAQRLAGGIRPRLEVVFGYIDQICSAVGFAHQRGVIHRDLKPANFMLTDQGHIKVLDFGIAKLGDAGMTQAGMVVGTPSYMAPEQASGRPVDHRSDIFALGAVFYELITGERAFGSQGITTVLYKVIHEDPIPPSAVLPSLPRGLDAIVQKALAKDPNQRYQSCEEMRKVFADHAASLAASKAQKPAPAVAEPIGTQLSPAPAARPAVVRKIDFDTTTVRRPRPGLWIMLAVCLIAALGIGGTWIVRNQSLFSPTPNAKPVPVKSGDATGGAPSSAQDSATTKPENVVPAASNDAARPAPIQDTQKPASANPRPASDQESAPKSANAVTESGKPQNPQTESTGAIVRKPKASKPQSPQDSQPAANVESVQGFTRADIPDLLRKADDAAGRGDYRNARFEYGLVLQLDRQNAAARDGMRRVQEIEKEKQ